MKASSILITGAGQGLGAALARVYAGQGISLFLNDLVEEKLKVTVEECRKLGAKTEGWVGDVVDQVAMERWVTEADDDCPLDLVIANAGISHGNLPREETPQQVREVFNVNINGTLNTIFPVLPRMRNRGMGQIGLMSSLAGYRGLPNSPSYCASKAAIRVFGQGLRARVRREGIMVSVIIPSFVVTPMTKANLYKMPCILEAEHAASIIKKNLSSNKSEFVFPWPYALAAWAISLCPPSLVAGFTRLR